MDSAVNGFLFLGSAGEFANLSQEQRKAIAEFCVAKVNGRKPFIIGTASCSTAEAIALTQHASDIGADAVMIVNPYYALMSDERLYNHYKSIADGLC
ncbi:dihydrodipicolinate synthase family protein [Symbiopectobacterium sp. Eva_TO]